MSLEFLTELIKVPNFDLRFISPRCDCTFTIWCRLDFDTSFWEFESLDEFDSALIVFFPIFSSFCIVSFPC